MNHPEITQMHSMWTLKVWLYTYESKFFILFLMVLQIVYCNCKPSHCSSQWPSGRKQHACWIASCQQHNRPSQPMEISVNNKACKSVCSGTFSSRIQKMWYISWMGEMSRIWECQSLKESGPQWLVGMAEYISDNLEFIVKWFPTVRNCRLVGRLL